jgi:dTDP-4-dehydrorhamnose reductase
MASCPSSAAMLIAEQDCQAAYCVGGATNVERCETDPEWAINTNFLGPVALAKAAINIPFVYFSTEYVFDGANGPYRETDSRSPISIYGWSKSLAEQEILSIHPRALIVRTTVVYGSDPREKNFLYSLRTQLSLGKTFRVPVDQISTPTYNRDLALATLQLVKHGASGIFHVCGPELLSRCDLAILAAHIMQLDASLVVGVSTAELNQIAPRPLHAGLSIDKLLTCIPSISMCGANAGISEWMHSLKSESTLEP